MDTPTGSTPPTDTSAVRVLLADEETNHPPTGPSDTGGPSPGMFADRRIVLLVAVTLGMVLAIVAWFAVQQVVGTQFERARESLAQRVEAHSAAERDLQAVSSAIRSQAAGADGVVSALPPELSATDGADRRAVGSSSGAAAGVGRAGASGGVE